MPVEPSSGTEHGYGASTARPHCCLSRTAGRLCIRFLSVPLEMGYVPGCPGTVAEAQSLKRWNVLTQRTRGAPQPPPAAFEIALPEGATTPPRGGSPPAAGIEFNAAAYLQRKSALNPKGNSSSSNSQRGRADPLDHRIRGEGGAMETDSDLESRERDPLL